VPEILPLPGAMISHHLTRSPESDNAILLKKRAKRAPPAKEDQDVNNLHSQRFLDKKWCNIDGEWQYAETAI
jgi:hypothetical protein